MFGTVIVPPAAETVGSKVTTSKLTATFRLPAELRLEVRLRELVRVRQVGVLHERPERGDGVLAAVVRVVHRVVVAGVVRRVRGRSRWCRRRHRRRRHRRSRSRPRRRGPRLRGGRRAASDRRVTANPHNSRSVPSKVGGHPRPLVVRGPSTALDGRGVVSECGIEVKITIVRTITLDTKSAGYDAGPWRRPASRVRSFPDATRAARRPPSKFLRSAPARAGGYLSSQAPASWSPQS